MSSAVEAKLGRLRDVGAWRSLAGELSIEAPAPEASPAIDGAGVERAMGELSTDGYCRFPGALDPATTGALRAAIDAVRASGVPPVFVFVFDEPWRVVARLDPLFARALLPGYRLLSQFWAWHVDPEVNDAGWRPHRDRDVDTIDEEGRPRCLTLWAALTDATPDNGCIYVLPASRDPAYRRDFGHPTVRDLQDVRALPATAGTLLCWDHAILHWGARANVRAAEPRVSLAFELTRAGDPLAGPPLLDPFAPPPFLERLRLIGSQLLAYQHMHVLSDELEEIATRLAEGR